MLKLDSAYNKYINYIHSIKPANARKEISNVETIFKRLGNGPLVYGVAPKLSAQVFYNLGNIELNGVVNGIEVEQEPKLFNFEDYVVNGSAYDLENRSNSIILGRPSNKQPSC